MALHLSFCTIAEGSIKPNFGAGRWFCSAVIFCAAIIQCLENAEYLFVKTFYRSVKQILKVFRVLITTETIVTAGFLKACDTFGDDSQSIQKTLFFTQKH